MTEHDDQVVAEEIDQQEVEIQEAFESAIGAGKDEDNIKLAMIGAGASFKNVTRLYNKFMIDAGLTISKADRDAAIASIVGDPAGLADEETFNQCLSEVLEQVKGSTERSAAAALRAFAKANDVEAFKKTKESSGGARSSGFRANVYALFVTNPDLTEEQLDKFANEDAATSLASDNDRKQLSHYHGLRKMVNAVAAQLRA